MWNQTKFATISVAIGLAHPFWINPSPATATIQNSYPEADESFGHQEHGLAMLSNAEQTITNTALANYQAAPNFTAPAGSTPRSTPSGSGCANPTADFGFPFGMNYQTLMGRSHFGL